MAQYSLYGFVIAMTIGGYMGLRAYRQQRIASSTAVAHVGFGLGAIGLLAIQVFSGPRVMLFNDALLLYAFAAVIGGLLLVFRIDKQSPPLLVVALHALFAVVGLSLLVAGYLH
jgi:hypothetical protein